jgi:alkyl hydroperoxide reductase subunit AhpC
MIGDTDLQVAKLYGMLPASASGNSATRTPADNATVRTVYVIGPDKQVKPMIVYPMNTGRNFDEVLRVVDSVQLTANVKVATPVNWKQGEDVIIPPAMQEAEARERFPAGWKAPLLYAARAAAARVSGISDLARRATRRTAGIHHRRKTRR